MPKRDEGIFDVIKDEIREEIFKEGYKLAIYEVKKAYREALGDQEETHVMRDIWRRVKHAAKQMVGDD